MSRVQGREVQTNIPTQNGYPEDMHTWEKLLFQGILARYLLMLKSENSYFTDHFTLGTKKL